MRIKHYLLMLLLSLTVFSACKKEEETEQPPVVKMLIEGTSINRKVNEMIAFSAMNSNGQVFEQVWKLDGEVKSNSSTYDFTPLKAGIYIIDYTATNKGGTFTYQYTVNVGMPNVPVTPGSNAFVTKMFEYMPAPGQFINKTFGTLEDAKGLEGKQGLVSLGAWGGYIVFGFDHTVINENNKNDIIIHGNAQSNFAEPGVIWVMQDENGNGKPDDTWYEIQGSEFNKEGYTGNYEVTYTKPISGGDVSWKDNKGNTGIVKIANPAFQAFPSWITSNEYTLKGVLLPSKDIDATDPGFITVAPFAYGYADNTAQGDEIDIADAIDKDGKKIALGGIDFIKIQTGIQADLGNLGELSTELSGVADLSLVK